RRRFRAAPPDGTNGPHDRRAPQGEPWPAVRAAPARRTPDRPPTPQCRFPRHGRRDSEPQIARRPWRTADGTSTSAAETALGQSGLPAQAGLASTESAARAAPMSPPGPVAFPKLSPLPSPVVTFVGFRPFFWSAG